MSEHKQLIADLVSAAKADDRHEINKMVHSNPDLDWAEMFRLACVDAIQEQAFSAAVLLNRAWENRMRRGNIKSIRAAGVELSLREATDEQLLAEVRRRELMR
ncbi:hypothetical protein BH766_gp87 [Gordonia phage Demosthenes]|uniref:Uncharacterized protein n=1 Tax=Gordonia phage Demosthenes TaxID=1838067 RepID=A0A160DDY8_9CAUD|nr:hypothetical protein BH766_gp87 [Gordonia phage Demosthenes]ANA86056.1 hypothetical protein PBI_DEMOSTHENES_87 [Gordonia phage Demosthenes]